MMPRVANWPLVWMLALRPRTTPLFTWRDVLGLVVGLWALLETHHGASV